MSCFSLKLDDSLYNRDSLTLVGIPMRKLLLTLALAYLSQSAFAEGFTKSTSGSASLASYQTISTVKAAKQQADGNTVVLEGHISDRAHTVNPEEFWFQDDTGGIKIEINQDVWRGQDVNPQQKIRILGEVDHNNFNNSVEIEVKQLDLM